MKIEFNFHDPAQELPEESGACLIMYNPNGLISVNYSKRHKAFNAFDIEDEPKTAVSAMLWAKIPKELNEYAENKKRKGDET